MAANNADAEDTGWKDLEPYIDAAIQELPEELQSPIILHYLQGKTQSEIAEVIGTDRSTVSRRLDKGRAELRGRLKRAGVVLSVAALVACLGQSALHAAPPALQAALGRMALVGMGQSAVTAGTGAASSPTSSAATAGFLGTLGGKIAAVVAVGAITVGGIVAHKQVTTPAGTGKEQTMAEKNIEGAGAKDDRREDAADDEISRCVRASLQDDVPVHVLTRTEEMAKQLAQSLAEKFGPEKVSFAAFDAPSVPTTPVVVSAASTMCFVYLRAEMRGPEECAKVERILKKTKVLVVNVSAEARMAPCMIRHMEDGEDKLLASIMRDDLFRKYRIWTETEGDRVVIEGVPTLSWESNGQCTFAGALECALTVTEHPYTYADLMGWSGLAFRFRWYQGDVGQRWCPSSAVGEFEEEKDAIEKATGWKLRWYFDDAGSAAERLIADVLASIEAGRPVLTYEPGLNVAVIYGYKDNGAALLLRDYFKGDAPQELPPADLPAFLCFLDDYGKPMATRDAFVEALKIGVRNWRRDPMAREKGKYFYGDTGFAKWIEDLSDETLTQEEREQVLLPYVFISLSDARGAAVTFLRDGAEMFEGEAREALMRATELYQQEGKLLRVDPPNDPKKLRDALIEARKLDAAAIAEIEKALTAYHGALGEVKPVALSILERRDFADNIPEKEKCLAGVPVAYVQALNHAGTKIDFAEFTAATGWAFSFGYKYDDISTAFMAVRGNPNADGPYEVFRFLPERLGYGYETAPVNDKDKLWAFVCKHIDAGTPVLSEHHDGGLFTGYREKEGRREVWFTWGGGEWLDINKLDPFEACVLVKERQPAARQQIYREALERAVRLASPHESNGVPQGLAALEAYLKDVADPEKDFAKCGEWFCWATFERLLARKCCAIWLESAADALGGAAREPLLAALGHYRKAHELYVRYAAEVGWGGETEVSLNDRARSAERIAIIVPLLKQGIEHEKAGITEMEKALREH